MILLFLKFFTEKNSDNFYKYKTNFNVLLEKIEFFDNSGELIGKSNSSLYNENENDFLPNDRYIIRE